MLYDKEDFKKSPYLSTFIPDQRVITRQNFTVEDGIVRRRSRLRDWSSDLGWLEQRNPPFLEWVRACCACEHCDCCGSHLDSFVDDAWTMASQRSRVQVAVSRDKYVHQLAIYSNLDVIWLNVVLTIFFCHPFSIKMRWDSSHRMLQSLHWK